MNNNFGLSRKTALRAGAGSLGLALVLAGTPAWAQATAAAPGDQVAAPAAGAATLDQATPAPADQAQDIVVTGTIFRRGAAAETALPITVLTQENIQRAAITNVTDAVRSLSADGAGSIGNGFTSGFSAGGSAVSLRNLGVSSTLVLIDGLRSTNFPLNDDGHNAYVDLNSIPLVNVQQIQVLKDGASALYGADAIGGVVNMITRKHIVGIEGGIEGGATQKGDGQKYRAHLLAGYGDYQTQGFNVYLGGDYEYDGRISADSRGFPFNTLDLRSINGVDNNRADDTLGTATTDAVVTRVNVNNATNLSNFGTLQNILNSPLAGNTANASAPALYTSLTPLANCTFGTYSENGTRVGTACAHDNTREYAQILPLQERYDAVARASIRLGDSIEGYVAASYAHDRVNIISAPRAIRQTQAFGGAPATSTLNPGIVLPVYICSSGVNCTTAADRRLNPNNPYAASFAGPGGDDAVSVAARQAAAAQGAARIYYLFGDVNSGSSRINEVYRISSGLSGHLGDSWNWNVESAYARDNLD